MKDKIEKKKMPKLRSDEEAEAFLMQDMRPYLHKGNFSDITLEFEPKSANINLRVSKSLLTGIKKRAKKFHMPYQRYIRHLLERDLYTPQPKA